MTTEKGKQPIYERKVQEVLAGINQGKNKDDLAKEVGYANAKSLDTYMGKKNFSWDGTRGIYYPNIEKHAARKQHHHKDYSKAGKIMDLFAEGSLDAKEIAAKMGFESHNDMADFMLAKDYIWNGGIGNYTKTEPGADDSSQPDNSDNVGTVTPSPVQRSREPSEFEAYLPLLLLLEEKKERLIELLSEPVALGQVPRYFVPGLAITKSVHLSSSLSQMAIEFSREKNVNQRELFEIALIDFFMKYGYEKEVKHLLKT